MATDIVEYFDVYNVDHIAAYKHLSDNGYWPKGFVPKDVVIPTLWQTLIASKMADAWVMMAMAGKVYGIPEYFPD